MGKQFHSVVTDIREESRAQGRHRWQMELQETSFTVGEVGLLEAVSRSGARIAVPVLEVIAGAGGEIWHVVEKPLAAGTRVAGQVDGQARSREQA